MGILDQHRGDVRVRCRYSTRLHSRCKLDRFGIALAPSPAFAAATCFCNAKAKAKAESLTPRPGLQSQDRQPTDDG